MFVFRLCRRRPDGSVAAGMDYFHERVIGLLADVSRKGMAAIKATLKTGRCLAASRINTGLQSTP